MRSAWVVSEKLQQRKLQYMRVSLQVDGGFAFFPGLNRSVSLDTAQIEPHQAAQIESLVQSANFFAQPSFLGTAAPGAADYRTYTLSVEDGQKVHVVRAQDPVQDQKLGELIACLEGSMATSPDSPAANRP